ncbi:MAG: tyrosine-type recombinase/integrase [Bacteroidetes bacterium]|nr:tyrosine-type recombinase/integrase [Bacteroidota bacterium]
MKGKTKKIRRIYLNQKLQDLSALAFEKLKQKNNPAVELDNYVFLNRFGSNHISIQYVNRMLPKFLNQINIQCKNAGSHTLRKTFGKQIYETGRRTEHSLIMLSELLHHSSIQSTRQYIGISDLHFKQAYLGL